MDADDPTSSLPLLDRSASQESFTMDESARVKTSHARESKGSNDIVHSPTTKGSSLYERKCLLINEEIDRHGMGRYQWCIWLLCGFGYLVDLMWAQAFGLVLSPLQQEFGFGNGQTGNISVSFSSGLTAGAFVWGFLVDIIGRKWAFNLTVFITSVFGLFLGVTNTYTTFLILTAFCGFGLGGNIPIDTTICLEFIPQNKRFLLVLLSLFQPIGVVITSIIAFGFIPQYGCKPDFTTANPLPSCRNVAAGVTCCSKSQNMGWRYLMYTMGAITLTVFFLRFVIFRFQESPKFLLYRGRDAEAVKVLEKIAKFNRKECGVTLDMFQALESEFPSDGLILGSGTKQFKSTYKAKLGLELQRYKMLFANATMIRLTVFTWLLYICDFWGFTVAGFYLPSILALKNGVIGVSLKATYASYIYIYAPGLVGVLIGGALYKIPSVGRKWTMVLSAGLMGTSIFLFSTVNDRASNIGLNVMEYFFQSMFNAVLYGWTPEAYPAPIRGTACGVASFWGRLFGIVSPLIAQHLYARTGEGRGGDINAVLYLAGGVTLGCCIWAALLPSKLVGRQSL